MDDRIEIDSPGGLLPGLTVNDITSGVSEIRNPVLARVFSEMGLMEEWGSGLRGVVKALAEEGLPAPEFVELPGRLRVTVHIKNHRPSISPTPGTTRGASEHVSEHVNLGQHAHAILESAGPAPMRRDELLAQVGLSNAYGNYRRNILPLVQAGYLAMTQPDSPRSTTQQYRLTDEGQAYLASLA